MIDSVFLLSVVTILSGIIGLVIRYTFRSKCSDVNCCFGCFKIKRDIQREIEVEQTQLAHSNPNQEINSPPSSRNLTGSPRANSI